MSGTLRPALRKKDRRRFGNARGKAGKIKRLPDSFFRVLEYVRRAPDVRHDKVADMRRRIEADSWNPASSRVAGKILHEHLFDSVVLSPRTRCNLFAE